MTRALLVALIGLLSVGCDVDDAFHCLEDAQCGDGGVCEANSVCSFEDEACDSGRCYGEHAPMGIADACVPIDDAAEPEVEPLEDEAMDPSDSVCGREATCEACLACTLFDGPCAAPIWTCSTSEACFDGITCGQTCLLTGACDDCCDGAGAAHAETIATSNACMVSECAALCGAAGAPQCS